MPILIFSILHPLTSPSFLNLAVCSDMLKGKCYQWIKGFEPTTPISYFNTELMRHVSLAQRIGKKNGTIFFSLILCRKLCINRRLCRTDTTTTIHSIPQSKKGWLLYLLLEPWEVLLCNSHTSNMPSGKKNIYPVIVIPMVLNWGRDYAPFPYVWCLAHVIGISSEYCGLLQDVTDSISRTKGYSIQSKHSPFGNQLVCSNSDIFVVYLFWARTIWHWVVFSKWNVIYYRPKTQKKCCVVFCFAQYLGTLPEFRCWTWELLAVMTFYSFY